MTRALIMAGGDDAKWKNHLGVRRHFVPINGEPLLARIVRQLEEREVEVWLIAPNLPEYDIDLPRVTPTTTRWGEEALNGAAAWNKSGRTILVYGDTVFTDAAMDTIAGFDRHAWQLFGRFGASKIKPHGEIFAMSFWPEHHAAFRVALDEAFRLKREKIIGRAGSWEAFRILGGAQGTAVAEHRRYPDLFTEIDDETDDFDTPGEYEQLARLFA